MLVHFVGEAAPTLDALGALAPPVASCPVVFALAGAVHAVQASNVAPSTLIDPVRTETSFVGLRG
jgi:hypothetical protein